MLMNITLDQNISHGAHRMLIYFMFHGSLISSEEYGSHILPDITKVCTVLNISSMTYYKYLRELKDNNYVIQNGRRLVPSPMKFDIQTNKD